MWWLVGVDPKVAARAMRQPSSVARVGRGSLILNSDVGRVQRQAEDPDETAGDACVGKTTPEPQRLFPCAYLCHLTNGSP